MWIQKLFNWLSCHKKKSFKNWYSWFVIQWLDKDLQCFPLALEHELFQSNIMKRKWLALSINFQLRFERDGNRAGKIQKNMQNENNI